MEKVNLKEARVRLSTKLGDIVLALDLDRAPVSAQAFLDAVDGGDFKDVAFVRAVSVANDHGAPGIEVIQTLPQALDRLAGGSLRHESTAETRLRHTSGVVSLARLEPGTASPLAFFI